MKEAARRRVKINFKEATVNLGDSKVMHRDEDGDLIMLTTQNARTERLATLQHALAAQGRPADASALCSSSKEGGRVPEAASARLQ